MSEEPDYDLYRGRAGYCGFGGGCDVRMPERGLCPAHAAEIRLAWMNVAGGGRSASSGRVGAKTIPGTAGLPQPESYSQRRAREAAARTAAMLGRIKAAVQASARPLTGAQLADAIGCPRNAAPLNRGLALLIERGELEVKRGPQGGYRAADAPMAA